MDLGEIIEKEKEKVRKQNKIATRSSTRKSPRRKPLQSTASIQSDTPSMNKTNNVSSSKQSALLRKIPKKRQFANISDNLTETTFKKQKHMTKSTNTKRKSSTQIQESEQSPERSLEDPDYFTTREGKRRKKIPMLPCLYSNSDGNKIVNKKSMNKKTNINKEVIDLIEDTQLENPNQIEDNSTQNKELMNECDQEMEEMIEKKLLAEVEFELNQLDNVHEETQQQSQTQNNVSKQLPNKEQQQPEQKQQ